jgi:hypothetical protein
VGAVPSAWMRTLIVGSLVGALVVGWASPCWACSCVMLTPREQAANADVIFTGRVLEAEDPFHHSGPRVQASLSVEQIYKGSVEAESVVETLRGGSAACGVGFRAGDRYTVFAFVNERGRLETNLCSGTGRGPIDPAGFGLPGARPATAPWLGMAAVLGAVTVVGVGAALLIGRLRRPGAT